MKTRDLALPGALTVLTSLIAVTAVAVVLVAPAATARPGPLAPVTLFGGAATSLPTPAAVAGDGSVVVGREVGGNGGRVEVQVRRPGRPWGRATVLQTAAAGQQVFALRVVGGPGGLAATWYDQAANVQRVSLLPTGDARWTTPRPSGVLGFFGDAAVDAAGRLWLAGPDTTGNGGRVEAFARTGAPFGVNLTDPPAGFSDESFELVVGADGVARVAFLRTRFNQIVDDFGSGSCSRDTRVMVTDVRRGSTAFAMTELAQHPENGFVTAGTCRMSSGEGIAGFDLVTGGGVSTLVTAVSEWDNESLTSIRTRRARPREAWPAATRVVMPARSVQYFDATTVAGRVVVLQIAATSPARIELVTEVPRGRWTIRGLAPATSLAGLAIAGSAGGGLVVWQQGVAPYATRTRALDRRLRLGPTLSTPGGAGSVFGAVVVDPRGDGGFTYRRGASGPARFRPYDATAPRLLRVAVPTTGRVGRAVRLRARATDTWAGVRRYTWRLDGRVRVGRSVAMPVTRAGRRVVVLTVTDARGNATTFRRALRAAPR